MKWVTAGVTFVNLSVVCGLLLGLAGRGLNTVSAALALVCGAAFALAAFLGTRDSVVRQKSANGPAAEQQPRKVSEPKRGQQDRLPVVGESVWHRAMRPAGIAAKWASLCGMLSVFRSHQHLSLVEWIGFTLVFSVTFALVIAVPVYLVAALSYAIAGHRPAVEQKPRKVSEPQDTQNAGIPSALMRYRRVWFWAVAVCFAVFAVRSFCWLLYIDSSELKIQSPNNLGDLSLHLTLINNFANGVALWPDNPIFVFSKLRYPAGIDLFNALLSLVHVDLLIGLVWVGLLSSLAIFYGFYRWGGTFAVAGFLFNGGVAGFQFLKTFQFLDYQGTAADIAHKPIAWKSIALSMLVTQRGWLYAIPAGLVLL